VTRALLNLFGWGRHMYPACRVWAKLFHSGGWVVVEAAHDIRLRLALHDAFWTSVLLQGEYEPDVEWLLAKLASSPTLFLDGGANIGWWSLVAEKRFGWNAVAVEPATHLAGAIRANRRLNDSRFDIVRKALWKCDDKSLRFQTDSARHGAGHLTDVAGYIPDHRLHLAEAVETVTVDTLVRQWRAQHPGPVQVVIKLDVEGAETEALMGAAQALGDGAFVVYEDHGADAACKATQAAFDLGLTVFALGRRRLTRISSLAQAKALKIHPKTGYNFVAVRPESQGPLAREINNAEPSNI
jgi:FkbM family methyltransferase